jgi:subtilisin family serine protease
MRFLKKLHSILPVVFLLGLLEIPLKAQTFRTETFQGQDVVAGEILVRFANGVQVQGLTIQDSDLTSAEAVGRAGALRLRSRNRNVAALLQAYRSRSDVLYAEPNYLWRAEDIPNDAFFGQQWALRNTGQAIFGTTGTPGADIKATQAWDITEGSRNVVVGVLDGGVDYNHPDLAANIWSAPTPFSVIIGGQLITCAAGTHGFNAITRTCDPMDEDGHGTHVAGIIAGTGNNGVGVSGINRVGSIMGLKFISATGAGTTVDAIAAIDFAIQVKGIFPTAANLRVLNASFGFYNYGSLAMRDEINLASSADMLFVASAGNASTTNDLVLHYPSGFDLPNILSIAATDRSDDLAYFSNWGATTVHLGAPGVDVMSTAPSGTFVFQTGTSMATPMVSGAAALVLSACPLTTSQLRANLLSNVDPLTALAGKTTSGGRLNVYRALTACAGTPQPAFRVSVTPGTQTTDINGSVNLTVTVTPVNGFTGSVALAAPSLPSGLSASFNPSSISGGSGTSTLTLATGPAVPAGTYFINVTGSSGAQTSTTSVALTVGATINPGQTLSGELTTSDRISLQESARYADFYRLTLSSTTVVTIDLKSRAFDTDLYLFSSSGSTLATSTDEGGNGNSRIVTTLGAGTYSIEVTSADDDAVGGYVLSLNTPTLLSMSPSIAKPGDVLTVTFTGTRFAAPLTINAGSDITVTAVSVLTSTDLTATFAVAANASSGTRDVTVTSADGTSNPLPFAVPAEVFTGQLISGALATTDATSRVSRYQYADLYRLTIPAFTAVTIDLRATAFDAYLNLYSATGTVVTSDDQGGGSSNARITTTLAAGTYYIEATSFFDREVGNYNLSINLPVLTSISPRFRGAGASATTVTLAGSNFTTPMTVDAGADITVSNVVVASATSATATFALASNATQGNRDVTATTSAGTSNPVTFRVFPPIPTISAGQAVSGTLTNTDMVSTELPGSYEDLYQLTIAQTLALTINLQSSDFDAHLLVLSSTGAVLASNDNSGGNGNARITATFSPGTFFLEVTSTDHGVTGNYTLSLGQIVLSSVSPRFGGSDTPVNVTLTGSGLTGLQSIDAGPGITVSNLVSTSGSSATATLTIAPNAAIGVRSLTATSPTGPSNPINFTVFPPITSIVPGQRVNGTLSTTDPTAPGNTTVYGDVYRLTLTSITTLGAELSSTGFDSYVQILSATGSTLFADNDSGGGENAKIQATLNPGTYYVVVTSWIAGIGDYTLALNTTPTLTAITPGSGTLGAVVGVTLTGTSFASPMTATGEGGVTLSNVTVLSPTTAIAKLTIDANATLGSRIVSVTTPYGTSGTITFDVTAPQAFPLDFPKLFSPSELGGTGFAIMNPTSSNANVTFSLFSASGSLLTTSNQVVPARGQLAQTGTEIFPSANQSGWIRATSSTIGLQSFWVGGNFSSFMDGASAVVAARELLFPLVTPQTEIGIANAGTGPNSVTIRVYGASGTELATAVTQNIAASGIYSVNAASLFPSVNFGSNTATLRVTGTQNISGTSVTIDYPVAPSWTVVNGIDASLSLFEVNFPHVPSGPTDGSPAWLSILGIANISTSAQTATFTFTNNNGSSSQATRVIPAGGVLRESVHTLFGFPVGYQEGWVKVSGTSALNGFIAYGSTADGGAAVVPAQGTPQSTLIFSHVANGPGWGTGLALLNAGSTDANVQVYVMRKTGVLVGGADNVSTASFVLPARTKVAKLINELVPAALDNDGFIFVRTTNNVPVYGMELFFTSDLKAIANVAAGILDPSITYTPPGP